MSDEMPLSARACEFRAGVENPARFPETCEGGDLGSPEVPAIWLFGLEPGWSKTQQNEDFGSGVTEADYAKYSVESQFQFRFNQNAFKLLAALRGESPDDYKQFASRVRPFERGSKCLPRKEVG